MISTYLWNLKNSDKLVNIIKEADSQVKREQTNGYSWEGGQYGVEESKYKLFGVR